MHGNIWVTDELIRDDIVDCMLNGIGIAGAESPLKVVGGDIGCLVGIDEVLGG
jgi:hypothetical protein